MSKPYLVINVVEGKVGVIYQRDTWDEAVKIGVVIAKNQCSENESAIRQELDKDGNYLDENKGFEVVIAQAEDD